MQIFPMFFFSQFSCAEASYNLESFLNSILEKNFYEGSNIQKKVQILTTFQLIQICANKEFEIENENISKIKDKEERIVKKTEINFLKALKQLIQLILSKIDKGNVNKKLEDAYPKIKLLLDEYDLKDKNLLIPLEIAFELPIKYMNDYSCFNSIYDKLNLEIEMSNFKHFTKIYLNKKMRKLAFLKERKTYVEEDLDMLITKIMSK